MLTLAARAPKSCGREGVGSTLGSSGAGEPTAVEAEVLRGVLLCGEAAPLAGGPDAACGQGIQTSWTSVQLK